jgi:dihydroxy-acid dehydratase
LLANLQPHGPYAMGSLHAIGGVPVVMKELLRAGLLPNTLAVSAFIR